ncbi:MAG TPA: VOC family protein [Candidatus Angelobacter sp.]|jgi:catechol 2,3-dioxygenase-like lactoylglutathione lyase family enzyme|nr:VOC family protein [Candidatus Angelobacter sp.]
MSAAPRLGYAVRFVNSLDAAVGFYQQVLGLRLTKRTDHWAQFDCGQVTLGLYERAAMAVNLGVAEPELGTPPGAFELAFEVPDCDAAFRAALDAGARSFRPPEDRPWGERTAYLLDPDGALVELYTRPRPAKEDAADHDIARGAAQGEAERRAEMATPSSESGQELSDPSD